MSTTVALVYSLLFGSTKFMFDFAQLLDELPAAAFFNYDKVSVENNLKFRYLLSKLVTLFITPQYHPIFPYEEPSYFGKFLYYRKWHPDRELTLHLLSIVLPGDITIKNCYVDRLTAADIVRPGVDTLTAVVTSWVSDARSLPILVIRLDTFQETEGGGLSQGHATFLALKKFGGRVRVVYVNPWGNPSDIHPDYVYVTRFTEVLNRRLQTLCGSVSVVPLVTRCPNLQTYEQGGNCATWELMLFIFFVLRPQYFDDPMPLLDQLGRHPELNMLLFSLFMFLKHVLVAPYIHYDLFLRSRQLGIPAKEYISKSINDDSRFRSHLFTLFPGSTNCSSHTVEQCPIICRKCEGKCATGFAVKRLDTEACHLLTPKELLQKMVKIDQKLHELTGDEYSEEAKQQVASVLAFQIPTTLQDYSRFTLQDRGGAVPLLTLAQVQEIETEENSKKRALEQEELYHRVGKRRRF